MLGWQSGQLHFFVEEAVEKPTKVQILPPALMKALLLNCRNFKWGSPKLESNTESIGNCLLVLLCCEIGDTNRKSKELVRRIKQLNTKRFKRDRLILFPFAHLSNQIMDIKTASKIVKQTAQSLSFHFQVTKLPFNKNKGLIMNLSEKNSDVSFVNY